MSGGDFTAHNFETSSHKKYNQGKDRSTGKTTYTTRTQAAANIFYLYVITFMHISKKTTMIAGDKNEQRTVVGEIVQPRYYSQRNKKEKNRKLAFFIK